MCSHLENSDFKRIEFSKNLHRRTPELILIWAVIYILHHAFISHMPLPVKPQAHLKNKIHHLNSNRPVGQVPFFK